MSEAERAAILAEIAGLWGEEDRSRLPQPNFTVAEAMRAWGLSNLVARRRLQMLEADGVLESGTVRDQGRSKLVFWVKPGRRIGSEQGTGEIRRELDDLEF